MAGYTLIPGERGQNYTGILTRSIVFSGALVLFLAGKKTTSPPYTYGKSQESRSADDAALATALTLASIIIPTWISFENNTVSRDTLPV